MYHIVCKFIVPIINLLLCKLCIELKCRLFSGYQNIFLSFFTLYCNMIENTQFYCWYYTHVNSRYFLPYKLRKELFTKSLVSYKLQTTLRHFFLIKSKCNPLFIFLKVQKMYLYTKLDKHHLHWMYSTTYSVNIFYLQFWPTRVFDFEAFITKDMLRMTCLVYGRCPFFKCSTKHMY